MADVDGVPRCPTCGGSIGPLTSATITQWIATCGCGSYNEVEPASFEICQLCKRRISSGRPGSFTQWIFRSDLCDCQRPVALAPNTVPSEPSVLEQEDEIEVTGPFPLDRYKPLGLIGSGGAGAVYCCRDKLLGKRVAVKLLRFPSREQLIRFQNEAKALSRLRHPNIVEVFDFGIFEGQIPYLVLEFVPGKSVLTVLRERDHTNIDLALYVTKKVVEALVYAHEHNVYHRDIKPDNILLSESENGDLSVKVTDFGLAKFKEQKPVDIEQQQLTLSGTPGYMAPDMISGKEFDARSEVYSVGCVLFEMLTGVLPIEVFAGKSFEQLPTLKDAIKIRKNSEVEYPNALENLVSKCLARQAEERLQTMSELLEELDSCQSSISAVGRVQGAAGDVSISAIKSNRRNFALISSCLVVGIAAVLLYVIPATKDKEIAADDYSLTALEQLANGDISAALKSSELAIASSATNKNALDAYALALLLSGRGSSALSALDRAIDTKNGASTELTKRLIFHRAVVLTSLERKTEAARDFSEAFLYQPERWELQRLKPWLEDWQHPRVLPTGQPNQSQFRITRTGKGMQISFGSDQVLERLLEDASLRDVNMLALRGGRYTYNGLTLLERTNVTSLTVLNAPLSDSDLSALQRVVMLKDLSLYSCRTVEGRFLEKLKKLPIRSVAFQNMERLSDESFAYLKGFKNLRTVFVMNCSSFSGSGWSHLLDRRIETVDWMPVVSFASNYMGKSKVAPYRSEHLDALLRFPELLQLSLDSGALDDNAFLQLSKMKKLKRLRLLGVRPMTAKEMWHLARCPHLECLELSGPIALSNIPALSASKQLRVLSLCQQRLDEGALRELSRLRIERLYLETKQFPDDTVRCLSQLKNLKQLLVRDYSEDVTNEKSQSNALVKSLKTGLPNCNVELVDTKPSLEYLANDLNKHNSRH